MTNRAGSRRRVDSRFRSDSSPDPGTGSEYDLAAPLPYAYASPPSIGHASSVSDTHIASVIALWGLEALTHESPDLRAGEYCSSELSVDCLRISYRTWAAWALDVMVPWNLWVSYDWISSGDPRVGDPQGLTCFWDERPCRRVPPSSAGFCLFLGSRDRGRDSFHAPDLSVRRPLSLFDEVFIISMKRVVSFIHRSDQVRRPPAWLSVSILRLRGALCSGAVRYTLREGLLEVGDEGPARTRSCEQMQL
ncbi:hypothetical protein Bca52824_048136 [Brassica carinata]|uniref:Uncharacterized protein n=1 Tax=Brassica carinata TaxID=52824 RepID=A0A8X7RID6_BRACI|nr:hypothetical protein Bca52824_048136 [Brassica carinata]